MELKDILEELVGAEEEASQIISKSRQEADRIVHEAREKFASEREARLSEAREQAGSITETARSSGEAEAGQIQDKGRAERDRMNKRYEEKIDSVIEALVGEIAEHYARREEN